MRTSHGDAGKESILLIADSESNADMLYATGLFVPDPFTYLKVDGKSLVMMSDLEIDRAREQSKVDEIVSLADYIERAQKNNAKTGSDLVNAISELLHEREVRSVLVPNQFPLGYADQLRGKGFKVQSKEDPFWDERPLKTDSEIAAISEVSRHTEDALRMAIGILSDARIKDGFLYGPEGLISSEYIRKKLHIYLLERDCTAQPVSYTHLRAHET